MTTKNGTPDKEFTKQRHVSLPMTTRKLPVRITREEFFDRSKSLSRINREISNETNRQIAQKAQMKERLAALQSIQSELAKVVDEEQEDRDVECTQSGDLERGMVEVFRTDTAERVEQRPLTDKERQLALPVSVQ